MLLLEGLILLKISNNHKFLINRLNNKINNICNLHIHLKLINNKYNNKLNNHPQDVPEVLVRIVLIKEYKVMILLCNHH